MLGIQSVASYLPKGRVDNLKQADRFETDREFVEQKTVLVMWQVQIIFFDVYFAGAAGISFYLPENGKVPSLRNGFESPRIQHKD